MRRIGTCLTVALFCAGAAQAALVEVSVTGQVSFNRIGEPPLSGVQAGEGVEMSFMVDSDVFQDGVPGDTRGYNIIVDSFALSFTGGVSVGLLPGGADSFFTLVDGFPVSDGFFVSTSPFSPGGAPLEQEPVNVNLDLGYTGDTLSSLNILDALGVYDFDGLTRFGFNLWERFPENVGMEMEFAQMTISSVPAPATLALLAPLAVVGRRRRRI